MNRLLIGSIAALGLFAAAAGLSGCGGRAEAKGEVSKEKSSDSTVVKVLVSEIKERAFEDWGSYSADLRGIEDAYLTAPYQGGRVGWVKPVGSRVSAGQALCDIDSAKYEAALQAAEAQVILASGDLERARVNVEKGSMGRSVLDAANLGFQNARMMRASAQRAYEDCRCQAPFNGILVSRSIDRYQTVTPGMPTLRLSRVDRLEATISLPESEAFSYKEGMKTEFRLLQSPDKTHEGKLASIDRAVDSRSRTVTGRITIVNSSGSLKPGMVGRVRILRHSYDKAIVVPSTALLRLQNGVAAMVVENGVARQRVVTVGTETADSSLVFSGLASGDRLIVTGAFQVSDGTKVTF